ncbi:hypothetical protein HA402_011371 [Bradysia odoriphaga]|nr:hypothetical protein HA402_011371 [Bradysia odoriphaga]
MTMVDRRLHGVPKTPTGTDQSWNLGSDPIERTSAMTETDRRLHGVVSQLEPTSPCTEHTLAFDESATDNESKIDEEGSGAPQKTELYRDELERRQLQDDLRKLGQKMWNGNAELNKNEFIPSRRPSGDVIVSAVKWTICPYCLGSYTKTNLRHHTTQFHKNPMKGQRMLNKLATIVEGRLHENASNRLAHVMGFMRQDHIVQLIRYDWLLIVYGNKLCCKYTPHYQENMIRARLRLNGRLLFEIKKIDPNVTDFASIFHVERYNAMVDAIKVIVLFDHETNEFGAPAMSSIAVTFVKQIGKYLSAECIRRRDRENKVETDDFLTYMDTDIDISINKLVAETQAKMRRRKLQNIPTMEDVKRLIQYINTERSICMEKLSAQYSYECWHKLGQLNMAWIIVFDRRRVGEVQNILIDEFLGRQSIDDDTNEQLIAKLSDESKSIARKFKRMKIRGKKGRTVPVLLKPAIEKAIRVFVSYREAAGVSTDSKYLFELPTSTKLKIKVGDGCQTLRKFSELCGAENPTSLRGTNLRKHMATTCVSLELNDAMVSEVSKYMGHDEKIHRDTYRQNTIDREVVQIAQVLEAAVGKCDMEDDDEDDCVGGEVWPAFENENDSTMNVTNVEAVTHGNHDDEEDLIIEAAKNVNLKRKFESIEEEPVKPKFPKMRWTNDEISSVRKAFAKHLKGGTLPTQSEIEKRQEEEAYASLRSRTWQQIKAYVNNQQKKKNK